uniref:Uncharacterized protein n=1 Tax=Arundo donax TaxID=35708 RepID=A0A0A9DWC0_ARUDO
MHRNKTHPIHVKTVHDKYYIQQKFLVKEPSNCHIKS